VSDRRLQGQIKYRNPSHAKINFIQLIFLFLLILSAVTERGKESKRTEWDTYRRIFYVYMHIVHIPLFPFLYIFKLNRDKKENPFRVICWKLRTYGVSKSMWKLNQNRIWIIVPLTSFPVYWNIFNLICQAFLFLFLVFLLPFKWFILSFFLFMHLCYVACLEEQ